MWLLLRRISALARDAGSTFSFSRHSLANLNALSVVSRMESRFVPLAPQLSLLVDPVRLDAVDAADVHPLHDDEHCARSLPPPVDKYLVRTYGWIGGNVCCRVKPPLICCWSTGDVTPCMTLHSRLASVGFVMVAMLGSGIKFSALTGRSSMRLPLPPPPSDDLWSPLLRDEPNDKLSPSSSSSRYGIWPNVNRRLFSACTSSVDCTPRLSRRIDVAPVD